MRMVYTFVFTLAVIVNSIEPSLQGDKHKVPRREKLPIRRVGQPSSDQHVLEPSLQGDTREVRRREKLPIRRIGQPSSDHSLLELGSQADGNLNTQRNPGSPSSARQHSPDQTSPERPPPRSRSSSPQGRPSSFTVLGYALADLGYIRLSPRTNPRLQFEFRRYIFPEGKPIRLRAKRGGLVPVPTREHIVLSAANGDIFAILEYSGVLRGMYATNTNRSRVKINMRSGAVDNMTSDEVRDCPLGERHPIFPYSFIKVVTKYNSLQLELNQSPDRTSPEEPPLRGRSGSPQGRPPSSEVLGYTLGELGYIRLCPRTNPSLQLEFRRYVFPADQPIRVRVGHSSYVPVPTREHIVLSAANGDIFAILEYSGVLRGIYATNTNRSRLKINMRSGAVDYMTSDEVRDCPLGERHPIFPYSFTKVVTKYNSLQSELNQLPDRTSPEEPPLRGRSGSPQGRPPLSEVLGYTLGELGYIRLSPCTNPSLQFELRRYIIPADKPIRVRAAGGGFVPVPTQEHIVLSTSNGDIFAILEYSDFLRGIYRTNSKHSRVKINMISGAVDNMTAEEARDCPLGGNYPISTHYFIKVVTNDSLQS